MYRWDFDDPARQHFATLSLAGQAELAAFMNAAVLVDPIEYQRHPGEPADPPGLLRTLHFGQHHAPPLPPVFRRGCEGSLFIPNQRQCWADGHRPS